MGVGEGERRKERATLSNRCHPNTLSVLSVIGTPFYLMEYCPGIIYKDPSLPGLEPSQRQAVYAAMSKVLCQIHSVDLKAAGLEDYGKLGESVTDCRLPVACH